MVNLAVHPPPREPPLGAWKRGHEFTLWTATCQVCGQGISFTRGDYWTKPGVKAAVVSWMKEHADCEEGEV
jgi:hypothetical protein